MTTIFGRTALALAMTIGLMAAPALAQDAAAETDALPEVPELALGPEDAKVTVVEYASYTCPHCAHFHAEVFKDLKTNYIDTGKVKFVFREVYFDRYGLWASVVARCGGPTRYFGISSMLFDGQKEWAASDDPTEVVDNLKKIGRTAGMDDATLTACLEDKAMMEAMVAKFQANVTADKIEGTPTLIINGEPFSNMSYADLAKILDEKLGG